MNVIEKPWSPRRELQQYISQTCIGTKGPAIVYNKIMEHAVKGKQYVKVAD